MKNTKKGILMAALVAVVMAASTPAKAQDMTGATNAAAIISDAVKGSAEWIAEQYRIAQKQVEEAAAKVAHWFD